MLTVTHSITTVSFPSSWQEVTLGQFLSFMDMLGDVTSYRPLLEALASDKQALHSLPAGAESGIVNQLTFLASVPDFDTLPVPTRIGGIVPPKHANLCPLIQKWCLEEWEKDMAESGKLTGHYIPMAVPILSIYLYQPLTGETFTDLEQAYSIKQRIEALPVLEALPLSAFFLASYQTPITSGAISFSINSQNQPRKGWRTILCPNWRSLRSLVHFPRWLLPGA